MARFSAIAERQAREECVLTRPPAPRIAINSPVFVTSAVALLAFLLFGTLGRQTSARLLPTILDAVSTYFGWVYVLAVAAFIAFCGWLLFSRYAGLRLGADDEQPEFHTLTWLSMLFSAGMGIGLVFYGVAEPMMHYVNPPLGEGRTTEAAELALPITFFHWGIHAWAIYALMALGISYFAFRQRLPLAIRSCFHPLLGERIHGWAGHSIDILAVMGTLFGLATSLGLGAMQVSAGLNHLFGVPHTTDTQVALIGAITGLATISLVTGVKRGIRRLSELNMLLALILLCFVFFVGPTRFLVTALIDNVGGYVGQLFSRTFSAGALDPKQDSWAKSWTLFYWGWWIAWAPFVGMFVARISRGRTIREFLLGVLLAPVGVTFLWLTVFGDTALTLDLGGASISQAVERDVSTAIYVMLAELPLSGVTSLLTVLLVTVFFVTSSDSASFVVDMLTSGGHLNPPIWQRVFWATAEGACAAALLYAGGDEPSQSLKALQAGVVSSGMPFCLVLIALLFSLPRALRKEVSGGSRGHAVAAAPALPTGSEEQEVTMKLEKILVPIDHSAHSFRGLQYALALGAGNAQIEVLHVVTRPAEYLPLDVWIWGEARDQRQVDQAVCDAATAALSEFVGRLPAACRTRVNTRLELGTPSQIIVETAEKGDYDMIVIGAYGQRRSKRALLGSVTQRVIQQAPCPVVTVVADRPGPLSV